MAKYRYEGPATTADFSQAVGATVGTEKYVFVRGGEYSLNKEEAAAILNPSNHPVDHRFVEVTDSTPPMVVNPTSVKEV